MKLLRNLSALAFMIVLLTAGPKAYWFYDNIDSVPGHEYDAGWDFNGYFDPPDNIGVDAWCGWETEGSNCSDVFGSGAEFCSIASGDCDSMCYDYYSQSADVNFCSG